MATRRRRAGVCGTILRLQKVCARAANLEQCNLAREVVRVSVKPKGVLVVGAHEKVAVVADFNRVEVLALELDRPAVGKALQDGVVGRASLLGDLVGAAKEITARKQIEPSHQLSEAACAARPCASVCVRRRDFGLHTVSHVCE